jgi:methylmalonyl-CoA mutase C-terminal domain/subunit
MSRSSSDPPTRARVLVAKTALDGHWRGLQVVAKTLRDGGFEVILIGMARDDEIAAAAQSEDVDLIGLNVGGRIAVVERILDKLVEAGVTAPVMAGGTIPPEGARRLAARGVATFPPGSSLEDIVTTARRLVEENRRTDGDAG